MDRFNENTEVNEIIKLVELFLENDLSIKAMDYLYENINKIINALFIANFSYKLAKKFELWRKDIDKPAGRGYLLTMFEELEIYASSEIKSIDILDKYMAESVLINEEDAEKLISIIGDKINKPEIFIRVYHMFSNNEKISKGNSYKILLKNAFENVPIVLRLIQMAMIDKKKKYIVMNSSDLKIINAINNEFYNMLKSENINKFEKNFIKKLGRDFSEISMIEEYFADIKEKIKKERLDEKEKIKESKKKAAAKKSESGGNKKGFFSNLFKKNNI